MTERRLTTADYDLTSRVAPNLDRHMIFPLLEFLQQRQLYTDEQILKWKIKLLNKTNMVDYAMDIYKSLYHTDDVPQDMVDRRVEIVARLKALEEPAAPLVAFLQKASAVQELRPDKQLVHSRLKDCISMPSFNLNVGTTLVLLTICISTRPYALTIALWGKLASEILMQNWDISLEKKLNRSKEIIDSKNVASPLNQMQSRIWLMHWSLFIFFNNDNGRTQIIDLFNQDNAPHLLRYLATAFVVNKRRRPQLKEFIKVIQQEQFSYKDPIVEFLACIYINYDLDGAQKKMKECEEVLANDPFLGKGLEDGNFSTIPLRDEFLENARLFIFETY